MAQLIHAYTRGGQTILHNIRMFIQISKKVLILVLALFILVFFSLFYAISDTYAFYVWCRFYTAKFLVSFDSKATLQFHLPHDGTYLTRALDIMQSKAVLLMVAQTNKIATTALILTLCILFCLVIGIIFFLIKQGQSQSANKAISGRNIINNKTLNRLIKQKKQASTLTLAGVSLIKDKEKVHFLCNGTTGTGKSVAVRELLDQIAGRGDKALILDRNGDFIRTHYDKEQRGDVILNTLDERTQPWDLWAECRDSTDYDSIAAALIPMPNSAQDPFWINGARAIFASAARQMAPDPKRSMQKLLTYLLTVDLDTISVLLKGTEAEALVSEKIAKTALSIRSVLAVYLRALKYVVEGSFPFSIRQWMSDDTKKNWVFVSSLADKEETLRPLLSTWLDIAANALISLEPNDNRRIWLILDELHSMQKMPYLQTALAEGRKYGGCIVITTHSIAQLRMIYGRNESEAISNLCNTRLHFRAVDTDSAQWSSNDLGKYEVEETNEGISYGANTIRDGISINRNRRIKPVVSVDEIMRLPDLDAYLRLPGNMPVTSLTFDVHDRKSVAKRFMPRCIDRQTSPALETLFEKNHRHLEETVRQKQKKRVNQKQRRSKKKVHDTQDLNLSMLEDLL